MANENFMGMVINTELGNEIERGTIESDPAGVGNNNAKNTIPNTITSKQNRRRPKWKTTKVEDDQWKHYGNGN